MKSNLSLSAAERYWYILRNIAKMKISRAHAHNTHAYSIKPSSQHIYILCTSIQTAVYLYGIRNTFTLYMRVRLVASRAAADEFSFLSFFFFLSSSPSLSLSHVLHSCLHDQGWVFEFVCVPFSLSLSVSL